MNKKFLIFTISLILFFISSICLAAGTVTFAVARAPGSGFLKITATCTADAADGSYPVTQIPYVIAGRYLFSVNTYYGATGPTDNTDLEILADSNSGYDILNGSGTNQIDNAANNHFKPIVNDPTATASDTVMPVYDDLYVKITNNSVNSAIVTIVLKFIK